MFSLPRALGPSEDNELRDDALSKPSTSKINFKTVSIFCELFSLSLLTALTVRPSRKKVYLRTIEMKICVFRTNAENNKSAEKNISHQFYFVFVSVFVLYISQIEKTKH